MGELLEWSLFLGGLFILWYIGKQNEQAQLAKQNQDLLGATDSANVVSYKALLAQWRPLEYENISDLKRELRIAVQKTGGDVKIEALKSASSSTSVSQESVTPTTSVSSPPPPPPPLTGINSYRNKERWRIVRGLDKRIIEYVLERDADIRST